MSTAKNSAFAACSKPLSTCKAPPRRLSPSPSTPPPNYRSNKAAARQTPLQLQGSGPDCVAVETDIADAPRAEQLLRTVVDRFGRIDVVVNNVGDFRWGSLAESSLEDWQSIFSSNLMTVLYMSRAALPHMRRGRWGRIINPRSEEHTSELQSHLNLVCRLLLEKKKKKVTGRLEKTSSQKRVFS